MKLIYDFGDIKGRILSTLGMIAIITNILTNIWLGILGNNSLFTFINNIYPFIDNHCLISAKCLLIMYPIYDTALQFFVLMKMHHIFKSFPISYRLNIISYKIAMIVSSITGIVLALAFSNGTRDTFKIEMIIAIDNNEYKQCIMPITNDPPKVWGYQVFWYILGFQLLVLIYIHFICITKLYQFNKYLNNGYIYNDFNMSFLQKHNMRKAKKIKNMLCLPIIGTVWGIFCLLIDKLFQYDLYQISRIIDTITILYFVNDYFTEKIEAALQHENNDNNNNLSIHLFQDLNEFNNINKIRFNIDKPFIKNAMIIFQTLDEIFCTECISQLIAEYASTLYLPCIDCHKLMGYIETYKDWGRHNGTMVNMDKFDNIRYYMTVKTPSWSQHIGEKEYEYDEDIDVLCVQCAPKYTQTFTIKENDKTSKEVLILFFP